MKIRKILAFCLSALLFAVAGCSTPNGEKASSTITSSAASSSSSSVYESTMNSSKGVASSKNSAEETASSVTQINSEVSSDGNGWVAYDTNKDDYKLHIKKADGTEDKVIVNDPVLAPCVAGEWVYYIAPLREIDKVKLDGSHKTKVCTVDAMEALNANAAVTAEYKDGYILYKLVQLREVGDSRPNTVTYYKLDLNQNKITEVKS